MLGVQVLSLKPVQKAKILLRLKHERINCSLGSRRSSSYNRGVDRRNLSLSPLSHILLILESLVHVFAQGLLCGFRLLPLKFQRLLNKLCSSSVSCRSVLLKLRNIISNSLQTFFKIFCPRCPSSNEMLLNSRRLNEGLLNSLNYPVSSLPFSGKLSLLLSELSLLLSIFGDPLG